jgi:pimeloyl-ACP methyl ester carboxylesterase
MAIVWIDRMAVDTRGEGDAVVFVHGLGGTMNVWTPLLPALARWRCVRVELPGAGRSHRAYAVADGAPLSAESHADALVRVCGALGIARAHFVGHSFGTLICQHLAVRSPALVRSLALFGALWEPSAAMRDGMRARAATVRAQGLFETAEGISEFALSPSSREQQPLTVAYVRESVLAQDAEGFARNCLALAEAQGARTDAQHQLAGSSSPAVQNELSELFAVCSDTRFAFCGMATCETTAVGGLAPCACWVGYGQSIAPGPLDGALTTNQTNLCETMDHAVLYGAEQRNPVGADRAADGARDLPGNLWTLT